MNEKPIQSWNTLTALIEQLLQCPNGQESEILQAHPELIGSVLIQMMREMAKLLFKEKGQENKVKSYIETEIARVGLSDYVSQVLVPKEKVYFPGYIMVEANLSGEVPHVIKSITGVIGFLGETKGGDPVPMRKSEVNRMLGKVDELSVQDENVAIPYTVGETVKVVDGPFNGFDGTVEKVNEEKRKLEVMVKIFGRKTPLELSYMQVEKI